MSVQRSQWCPLIGNRGEQKMNEAFLWFWGLKASGCFVIIILKVSFARVCASWLCYLVSQLIRVNTLIDCLLLTLILRFLEVQSSVEVSYWHLLYFLYGAFWPWSWSDLLNNTLFFSITAHYFNKSNYFLPKNTQIFSAKLLCPLLIIFLIPIRLSHFLLLFFFFLLLLCWPGAMY